MMSNNREDFIVDQDTGPTSKKFQRENNYNLEDYTQPTTNQVWRQNQDIIRLSTSQNIYSQASFLRKLLKDASQQTGN